LAELERDAPRVAEHDEQGAVGLGLVEEMGRAGGDETGGVGAGVGRVEGDVKTERVRGGEIGDGGGGVVVDLEGHSAGVVGEEVFVGRFELGAGDLPTGVVHIPCGEGAGIWDVEGEVFEFHGWRGSEAEVAALFVDQGGSFADEFEGDGEVKIFELFEAYADLADGNFT
jgi:hypothetical protein